MSAKDRLGRTPDQRLADEIHSLRDAVRSLARAIEQTNQKLDRIEKHIEGLLYGANSPEIPEGFRASDR